MTRHRRHGIKSSKSKSVKYHRPFGSWTLLDPVWQLTSRPNATMQVYGPVGKKRDSGKTWCDERNGEGRKEVTALCVCCGCVMHSCLAKYTQLHAAL